MSLMDVTSADPISQARKVRLSNKRQTAIGAGKSAGSLTNLARASQTARQDPGQVMRKTQTALSGRGPESPAGTTLLVRRG